MARRDRPERRQDCVVVSVIDDIDGEELQEAVTVIFGLDGKQYEFDTSPSNSDKFRASLASTSKRHHARESLAVRRIDLGADARLSRTRRSSLGEGEWL